VLYGEVRDHPGGGIGIEAILLVICEAVIGQRVVATEYHPGAGVVPHGRMVDRPVRRGVMVHHPLVLVATPASEVLDREETDGHVRGGSAKGVGVHAFAVNDGAWRTDESGAVSRRDLRVLA